MTNLIKKIFNIYSHKRDSESYNSLYDFCMNYPIEKKEKLFTKAIKEANKEQRDLIKRYDKMKSNFKEG